MGLVELLERVAISLQITEMQSVSYRLQDISAGVVILLEFTLAVLDLLEYSIYSHLSFPFLRVSRCTSSIHTTYS